MFPPFVSRHAVTSTTAVCVRRTVLHPPSMTLSHFKPNPTQTRSSTLVPPVSRRVHVRTLFGEKKKVSCLLRKARSQCLASDHHAASLLLYYPMIKCSVDSISWGEKKERNLSFGLLAKIATHTPGIQSWQCCNHIPVSGTLQAISFTCHHI